MLTMTMTTFILRYRFNMCSSWSPACFTTSTQFSTQSYTQSSQSVSAEDSPTYLESAGSTRYVWLQILILTWRWLKTLQKFAKAVSRRSKEESSLDQELAEFNLVNNSMSLSDWIFFISKFEQVINVEGRTTNCSGGRVKHFMSKERREKILKRWDLDKPPCLRFSVFSVLVKLNQNSYKYWKGNAV